MKPGLCLNFNKFWTQVFTLMRAALMERTQQPVLLRIWHDGWYCIVVAWSRIFSPLRNKVLTAVFKAAAVFWSLTSFPVFHVL